MDFETNIHQNKDWNLGEKDSLVTLGVLWDQHPSEQGLKLNYKGYHGGHTKSLRPTSIRTRIETHSIYYGTNSHVKLWDQHPSEQGLKPKKLQILEKMKKTLRPTSIRTRIETMNQGFFTTKQTDFETNIHQNKDWNKAPIISILKMQILWDQHPSEQGLKLMT